MNKAVHINVKTQMYESELSCKICGCLIFDEEDVAETYCEHTLFFATNEGFEFCDNRTKKNLGISETQDLDELLEGISIDELTNKITIPNSHKIVLAGGSASMLELYYGYVE
jgi:hypothetical protein